MLIKVCILSVISHCTSFTNIMRMRHRWTKNESQKCLAVFLVVLSKYPNDAGEKFAAKVMRLNNHLNVGENVKHVVASVTGKMLSVPSILSALRDNWQKQWLRNACVCDSDRGLESLLSPAPDCRRRGHVKCEAATLNNHQSPASIGVLKEVNVLLLYFSSGVPYVYMIIKKLYLF